MQTVVPALTRKPVPPQLQQEWLESAPGVRLELFWARNPQTSSPRKLVILQHGLEGHATRFYMIGLLNALMQDGWDGLVWSYRGCGESANDSSQSYHAGFTDDLAAVVEHALEKRTYEKIGLAGFSMGGNLSLKYAGERQTAPEIAGVFAISVPCDLASSAACIRAPRNWIFQRRFLKSLRLKIAEKREQFPDLVDYDKALKAADIVAFDDHFTAPASGFRDANDYYTQNSSLQFLENISVPFCILNAWNDPFLGDSCYPEALARKLPRFNLVLSNAGGHCGFSMGKGRYLHEETARNFFQKSL